MKYVYNRTTLLLDILDAVETMKKILEVMSFRRKSGN